MSWVRRVPPGDPDYFCDCPPCPFCFARADEGGEDRPEKKKRRRTRAGRFVLPLLAGIAFALTVGITMRHEGLSTWASAHVSTPTSPPVPGPTPTAPRPIAPQPASETPAASSATPAAPAALVSDPAQPEVPVSLIVKTLPDGAQRVLLRNLSAEPLQVTIMVSDTSAQNKYTTQVSLAAADVTKLDGITTVPGDRIILASAGYRDQVTPVD